jgi:hypothetical protein
VGRLAATSGLEPREAGATGEEGLEGGVLMPQRLL